MRKAYILFFLLTLSQNAHADDRLPIIIEHNGSIGEYSFLDSGKLDVNLVSETVNVYASPLLIKKKGVISKKDKVSVLKSVVLLYKFGEAELKEPLPVDLSYDVFVLNRRGGLQDIVGSMMNDGFSEGYSMFKFPEETLYKSLNEMTKMNKKVALYRYSGEGYSFLKVGQYFVLIDNRKFNVVEKEEVVECYQVSSDDGVLGWVVSTQLTGVLK